MIVTGEVACRDGRCSRGSGAAHQPAVPRRDDAGVRARPPPAPVRLAWFYVPNGIDMRHWTPAAEGPLGDLPGILAPLEPVKNELLVLSNLTTHWGRPLQDGAGRSRPRARRRT